MHGGIHAACPNICLSLAVLAASRMLAFTTETVVLTVKSAAMVALICLVDGFLSF